MSALESILLELQNGEYVYMKKELIGVDLFSGAGGLSLGAEMAGVCVKIAVESDPYAAKTYRLNHPYTLMLNQDIRTIKKLKVETSSPTVLFGGPPCQGFSTSNQKTRNKSNPQNWLYKEFIRLAKEMLPDWIVFENVRGIIDTEKGYFSNTIVKAFSTIGYTCSPWVLCASDYGIPQTRSRFFLIGSLHGKTVSRPAYSDAKVTVKDAIEDLPNLESGANQNVLQYRMAAKSNYAKWLRRGLEQCSGHLVTRNSNSVLARYPFIPQGGNWEDIPDNLMVNYSDKSRCHTGIYKRLSENEPSITVGNYRKSMLIHPWEDRGLSVREAARLQSFPDDYVFCGSIGFQQQQVGNAVPPLLARAVFQAILKANWEE